MDDTDYLINALTNIKDELEERLGIGTALDPPDEIAFATALAKALRVGIREGARQAELHGRKQGVLLDVSVHDSDRDMWQEMYTDE